jgi:hypothetical protein
MRAEYWDEGLRLRAELGFKAQVALLQVRPCCRMQHCCFCTCCGTPTACCLKVLCKLQAAQLEMCWKGHLAADMAIRLSACRLP